MLVLYRSGQIEKANELCQRLGCPLCGNGGGGGYAKKCVALKNMATGEQQLLSVGELLSIL